MAMAHKQILSKCLSGNIGRLIVGINGIDLDFACTDMLPKVMVTICLVLEHILGRQANSSSPELSSKALQYT